MSRELETMAVCISLSNVQHPLESRDGWSEEDVIIRVSKDPGIFPHDTASIAAALEEFKEIEEVEELSKSCEDFSLADTVTYGKTGGELVIPSNIGELLDIHKDD